MSLSVYYYDSKIQLSVLPGGIYCYRSVTCELQAVGVKSYSLPWVDSIRHKDLARWARRVGRR